MFHVMIYLVHEVGLFLDIVTKSLNTEKHALDQDEDMIIALSMIDIQQGAQMWDNCNSSICCLY